jgi:hypothetical protein
VADAYHLVLTTHARLKLPLLIEGIHKELRKRFPQAETAVLTKMARRIARKGYGREKFVQEIALMYADKRKAWRAFAELDRDEPELHRVMLRFCKRWSIPRCSYEQAMQVHELVRAIHQR